MLFLALKSLHIIFVVTWFAGLFYIVRLYIYHTEAQALPSTERDILSKQYKIMQKRLWYGITWPSAVITFVLGPWLAMQFWPWSEHPWLLAKLGIIFFLAAYHWSCQVLYQRLQADQFPKSGQWLRAWNEVATLFLFAIVFLVVFKDLMSMAYGIVGLIVLGGALGLAIGYYKRVRKS